MIAAEIQRYRKQQGMSAQDLANACTALGLPISRSALANLESGRRPIVSVAELLVFGKALRVPPALLLFPVGIREEMEVLPGQSRDTWDALVWFMGEGTIDSADDWDITTVEDYRWHEELVSRWQRARAEARRYLITGDPAAQDLARANDELAESIKKNLVSVRNRLRGEGISPPKLPPELGDLEETERPA
ncbi:hypothetical protein B1L11_38485 [Microbispora sp. GKU 823]|nr:hypothetical protein B1L11_38485 [Microbispora sp. GKU 823]